MEEMEELKALFRVCVHIKNNGIRCGSPALTGSNFCWQHMGGTVASLARARSSSHDTTARINFAYPGDRESIQHNFFLIAEALNDGKIDTRTANTYIRLFRAAEQNLHRWEKKKKKQGNNPEKQMRPLPTKPEDSPFKPGSPLKPDGGPLKPAPGLSGEPDPKPESSANDPEPLTQPEIRKQETPEIDWTKYDDRFREIDQLYSHQPDYADRINATIQEIVDSETAAHAAISRVPHVSLLRHGTSPEP